VLKKDSKIRFSRHYLDTVCATLPPMKPLFTIHAGEYLVGLHVPKYLKSLRPNVWIPAKDTGIDLLVTDSANLHAVSLQVKYGKDFLPEEKKPDLRRSLRCRSWFTLNRAKLDKSQAQFWVFVLRGFESDAPDFVVVPKAELQRRMKKKHTSERGTLQIYLCSTKKDQCWEMREVGREAERQIAEGSYEDPARDFTKYLNKDGWAAVANRLKS
jgi:hypothetical protein